MPGQGLEPRFARAVEMPAWQSRYNHPRHPAKLDYLPVIGLFYFPTEAQGWYQKPQIS